MPRENPSPQALKLREFFNSPEGQAYIEEEKRKREAAEAEAKRFFFSPEFQVLYDALYAATEGGFIQTDDHPLVECCEAVTDKEVENMVVSFQVIKSLFGNKYTIPVELLPACDFPDDAFLYKDLIFQTICGQGCFTRIMRSADWQYTFPNYREEEDLAMMDIMN